MLSGVQISDSAWGFKNSPPFPHVIAGSARVVGALSAALPGTAFLCTSREPLRIAGERVMSVAALDADDARRLFVDRVATSTHGASLSTTDSRAVATICRKLDGIPLALELAAACARVIDVEHVATGLDERFTLLRGGSRAASDRHTTLHATIAWSYDLLDAGERYVFECAAAINGSFTLDDLLAVTVDETFGRVTVLAGIAALVEKSLAAVECDEELSGRRYYLLESTRAFATEAATARDGDSALGDAHRRLGRHLTEYFLRAIERHRAGDSVAIRDGPLDQLRGYLGWAIEKRGDVAAGTQLAAAIHFMWDLNGLHLEGIRHIESGLALLADGDANATTAMDGWYAVARLKLNFVRNSDCLAPALRAYALAERLGDDHVRARAAEKIALAHDLMGERDTALTYVEEAIALYEGLGDRSSGAYAECTAAILAFKYRRDASSLERFRLAVERQRDVADPWRSTNSEVDLAEAYHWFGKTDEAIATVRPAIVQLRKSASPIDVAVALNNLSVYLTSTSRHLEAIPIAREALHIGRDFGFTRTLVLALRAYAMIAALSGREPRRCAQLFGYVESRYDTTGENGFTETDAHERLRIAVTAMSSDFDVAAAIREGEAFDDNEAIEAALACVAHEDGDLS